MRSTTPIDCGDEPAIAKTFGNVSKAYPDSYSPKPYSRSFVVNIDLWYAQSHPVEDFAETFAVWLKPRSKWRQTYHNWPAVKKLEYVDGLMKAIRVRSRRWCVRGGRSTRCRR